MFAKNACDIVDNYDYYEIHVLYQNTWILSTDVFDGKIIITMRIIIDIVHLEFSNHRLLFLTSIYNMISTIVRKKAYKLLYKYSWTALAEIFKYKRTQISMHFTFMHSDIFRIVLSLVSKYNCILHRTAVRKCLPLVSNKCNRQKTMYYSSMVENPWNNEKHCFPQLNI